jgi:hypothetical protein
MLGLQGKEALIRAYGGREIASGIGSLSSNPAPAIWGRVGGDLLDLATLASSAGGDKNQRRNAGMAIAGVLGITLLDVLVAAALSQQNARPREIRDYSDRTGFPKGPSAARGAASNFKASPDMRSAPAVASSLH